MIRLILIINILAFSITIHAQTNLLSNGDFKANTNNLNVWPATNWTFLNTHPPLRIFMGNKFLIGVAKGADLVLNLDSLSQLSRAIVQSQFNQFTPENELKWASIEPQQGNYNYVKSDALVNFALKNNMVIKGHVLIWNDKNDPAWVFVDANGNSVTRQILLARMKDHITSLVGRYKGKFKGWDVVNEAIADDGTIRTTKYSSIIGPDYIDSAFVYAHAADPTAELYYNDGNYTNPARLATALSMVNRLRSEGIPITALGEEAHWSLTYPSISAFETVMNAVATAGLKLNIAELDVDVLPFPSGTLPAPYNPAYDPYKSGLPNSVLLQLASRYGTLFTEFAKYSQYIDFITFWGLDDGSSWLNNFPMLGRTNYPLLYDRQFHVKIPVLRAIEAAVK